MAYKHDIFVSYRRDPQTLVWIARFLHPIVKQRVGLELGEEPVIYVHEITGQIQAGTAWPADLGETLAHSRVLIALWAGNYLTSEWCRQELSLMIQREREQRRRAHAGTKYRLVIPIVVHDGEDIQKVLGPVQYVDVSKYFFSNLPQDSVKAAELEETLAQHAKGIADAIRHAPTWRKDWPRRAAARLLKTFKRQQESQRTLPRHGRV